MLRVRIISAGVVAAIAVVLAVSGATAQSAEQPVKPVNPCGCSRGFGRRMKPRPMCMRKRPTEPAKKPPPED